MVWKLVLMTALSAVQLVAIWRKNPPSPVPEILGMASGLGWVWALTR